MVSLQTTKAEHLVVGIGPNRKLHSLRTDTPNPCARDQRLEASQSLLIRSIGNLHMGESELRVDTLLPHAAASRCCRTLLSTSRIWHKVGLAIGWSRHQRTSLHAQLLALVIG